MSLNGIGPIATESAMDEVHQRVKVLAKQIEHQTQVVERAKAEVVREKDTLDYLTTRFTEWVEIHTKLKAADAAS